MNDNILNLLPTGSKFNIHAIHNKDHEAIDEIMAANKNCKIIVRRGKVEDRAKTPKIKVNGKRVKRVHMGEETL